MLHPAVAALLAGSLLVAGMLLYASRFAVRVVRFWDLASGSEEQLLLERQTSLVSTLVAWGFVLQLVSLFFFVALAESLSSLVVGAMCAAGVLNANPYGYPALLLKLANFFLAGGWLLLNHLDTRGYDYPLTRRKYFLLLALIPMFLSETALTFLYFATLRVNVITSCCGSLFSEQGKMTAGELAALPPGSALFLFFATMAAVAASGLASLIRRKGSLVFSLLAILAVPVTMAALIACISPYFYELPTHHCPFCIMKAEYRYVGYLLLGALLGGGLSGMGAGLAFLCRRSATLEHLVPSLERRLTMVALGCYLLFTAVVLVRMLTTEFRLLG